ncbi:ABC transporter ATP-binding protein [Kitasatospora phosalacinea]|uniref:ATP-binding cassette domain-containing protein n=1 Tax=Kitasatospora phosalacinea TaxID=2065 RepID=UPI00068BEB91|nr:ABC transporter ATP-binding protein [Kitasatospora phosalacinea]
MSLLTIDRLTVEHPGGVRAVQDVSLRLDTGRALVLLGESGSGKTTLARAVLGLPGRGTAVHGSIRLGDTELLGLPERELARVRGRRIGYVPQDPSATLDPLRRIGTQLAEVLRVHGLAATRREARAAAPPLLAAAGLPEPERAASAYPHELSGGLRQRAAIALAIACGPELLVADEPTTALDTLVRARILDLFTTLRTERGLALLLVTHDLSAAARIGDTVAVLADGRLAATGPAKELLSPAKGPGRTAGGEIKGPGDGGPALPAVGARRGVRAAPGPGAEPGATARDGSEPAAVPGPSFPGPLVPSPGEPSR